MKAVLMTVVALGLLFAASVLALMPSGHARADIAPCRSCTAPQRG